MVDLLELNDGALLQALKRQRVRVLPITAMLHETDSAERAGTQGRQDVEVVQVELTSLFTLRSISNLFRRLIIVH